MDRIFISYRRDDSAHAAARLFRELRDAIPTADIFMDVDSIPPGVDFVQFLEDEVASCTMLLAVIGPRWVDARDDGGRLKLHNPLDFVRIEIVAAFNLGITVVPLLLDNIAMPDDSDLPTELKQLTRRQAISLSHERFGSDVRRLVEKLQLNATPQDHRATIDAQAYNVNYEELFDIAEEKWNSQSGIINVSSPDTKQHLESAKQWYLEAANGGEKRAMFRLGFISMLLDEEDLARTWYLKAAHKLEPHAMFAIGRAYQEGTLGLNIDNPAAAHWLQGAMAEGHPAAKLYLAKMYDIGQGGLQKSSVDAARLLIAALKVSIGAEL